MSCEPCWKAETGSPFTHHRRVGCTYPICLAFFLFFCSPMMLRVARPDLRTERKEISCFVQPYPTPTGELTEIRKELDIDWRRNRRSQHARIAIRIRVIFAVNKHPPFLRILMSPYPPDRHQLNISLSTGPDPWR